MDDLITLFINFVALALIIINGILSRVIYQLYVKEKSVRCTDNTRGMVAMVIIVVWAVAIITSLIRPSIMQSKGALLLILLGGIILQIVLMFRLENSEK